VQPQPILVDAAPVELTNQDSLGESSMEIIQQQNVRSIVEKKQSSIIEGPTEGQINIIDDENENEEQEP